MQRFGKPGKTLVGSDSHTPAAGPLGVLAFGAGGIAVALAAAGEPAPRPLAAQVDLLLAGGVIDLLCEYRAA